MQESTNDLDMHEKRLLVLGPLLNLRKAITGMLTPAEFRALSHSFVTFVIDTYGLESFLAVMSTKVSESAQHSCPRHIAFGSTAASTRPRSRVSHQCRCGSDVLLLLPYPYEVGSKLALLCVAERTAQLPQHPHTAPQRWFWSHSPR